MIWACSLFLGVTLEPSSQTSRPVIEELADLWGSEKGYTIDLGEQASSRSVFSKLDQLTELQMVKGCNEVISATLNRQSYYRNAPRYIICREALFLAWGYYLALTDSSYILDGQFYWTINDLSVTDIFRKGEDGKVSIKDLKVEKRFPEIWILGPEVFSPGHLHRRVSGVEAYVDELADLWKNPAGWRVELGEVDESAKILEEISRLKEEELMTQCSSLAALYLDKETRLSDPAAYGATEAAIFVAWIYYSRHQETAYGLEGANKYCLGKTLVESLFSKDSKSKVQIKPFAFEVAIGSLPASTPSPVREICFQRKRT